MIYDLQKASLMKRISAFLLDFIIMMMLSLGLMLLLSHITGYDTYSQGLQDRLTEIQNEYNITELEKEYLVSFNDYQYLSEEDAAKLPEALRDNFNACYEKINTDSQLIRFYETIMSLSLLICSLGLLFSFLILEFAIPLLFKNGQTLGKKLFSIAVVRVDCVRVSTFELFIRSILGKYTIGTMVPVIMLISLMFGSAPIVSLTIILLILLLQLVTLITTKTNSLIHDKLASTVVVDLQSQMIFDSVDAMNEYKLRIHKEQAEKAQY